jgi:immunity protein, SdpI family
MRSFFVDGLHFAFVFLLLALTLVGFMGIPYGTVLPVHWNFQGQVDATLPREFGLLVVPMVAAFLIVLLWLFRRILPQTEIEAGKHIWQTAVTWVTGVLCAAQATVVLEGMGVAVPRERVVALVFAVFLILLGNVLPKSRPNHLAGIRVPWTLADEANWTATHRFAGPLFILAGVVLGLAGLLTHDVLWLRLCLLAALLVPAIAGVAYSYWFALRKARDTRA